MVKNMLPAKYRTYNEFICQYGTEVGYISKGWYDNFGVTEDDFVAIYKNNYHDQLILFTKNSIYSVNKQVTNIINYEDINEICVNSTQISNPSKEELKLYADSLVLTNNKAEKFFLHFDGSRGPNGIIKDAYSIWGLIKILKKRK